MELNIKNLDKNEKTHISELIKIKEVDSASEVYIISDLAARIWTEHYLPIIGEGQVVYMLKKFQSVEAIYRDIASGGCKYYIACINGAYVAYCAIKADAENRIDCETRYMGNDKRRGIFLSKLYVEKPYRGRGIAKRFIEMVKDIARQGGVDYICLTVNKNNKESIATYEKMGFLIVEGIVTHIGGGYFMDDYKMVMQCL